MKRLMAALTGFVSASLPAHVLASEAHGGYQGIAAMYYTLIAVVLIYGVYDTFGKKAMYIGAPIIVILAYVFTSMAPE